MPSPALKDNGYTYTDYRTWPDDERWEIIDGGVYDMSPAPRVKHQVIAGNFFNLLKNKMDNRCRLLMAPTDVVFNEHNVVQPDLLAVCDRSKITELNIRGAPDFIVEIISPSTSSKDRREKKNLYERFGVREYVIVFPDQYTVERHHLQGKKYGQPDTYNFNETLSLYTLEIDINLAL